MRACSCGDHAPHRIARRTTADGILIVVWSDGWLTDRMGLRLAKLRVKYDFDRDSLWALAGLIGFFDLAELRPLVLEWKRARRQVGATDETARLAVLRRMPGSRPKPPTPPNNDALYRELVTAAGMKVYLRIR